MIRRLFSWVTPRSHDRGCREDQLLRLMWEQASEPCFSKQLEVLELYEERKAEARSALVSHRQACRICRGEVRATEYEPVATDEYLSAEFFEPEEGSPEHTREAA